MTEAAPTLVVGIGASAGGLEAFRAFFAAMAPDSGMAFVLVQHLDPGHASALVEILRNSTAMSVSQAEDGEPIAPNCVFVIPPNAILTIKEGVLRVVRPAAAAARRASVDTFLISLAEDQGEKAVAIVLAGFGSDGKLGVEAIKEHGGLTLTQAEFDHAPKPGMPSSAVSSGSVDHVLAVEAMPAALIDHQQYRARTDATKGPDGVRSDLRDHLGAICAVLNGRLGRDFSQYKPNTLMRRVQRRMQVLQIEDAGAYIDQLRARRDEPELLFREVLIRVTRFFRDRAAFDALAAQIPAILARGDAQDTVRVWVPGCATGEEAYSIAILLKEALARADRPRKAQISATDIDDKAIEIARAGVYPDTIATDVPHDLLTRHFSVAGEGYRVSKDLRELCLFSTHDLVKDPPFSRLDLISCRNLMIYFAAPLQKRVVSRFHYGLRPDGVLFLGASEAVTTHATLFAALDKKHRIFVRRDAPPQLLDIARTDGPSARASAAAEAEGEVDPRIARVMARYTPAFAVIDQRQQMQQLSGPIGKYLAPTSGAVSMNLAVLIHPDLRGPLRKALKQVTATRRRVLNEGLTLEIDGRREALNLVVEPLDRTDGPGQVLVAFQDLGVVRPSVSVEQAASDSSAMYAELIATRERLQTLAEELETSNEELQSSNEEYQSINEEVQSTNEELETSKEELQSMNEELATLNAELNTRNDALVDLNSDLINLIDSTSIATLFLDQQLRIKRFTPPLLDLFNVREGDQGRPITDIVSRLAKNGLQADAEQVLKTLAPLQREVRLESGARAFQMQIRPYRGTDNVINGVVVTFVDITERERAELDRAHLAAIVDSSDDAVIGHDRDGTITSWNHSAEALFGYAAADAVGQSIRILLPEGSPDGEVALLAATGRGETVAHHQIVCRRKDGTLVDVSQAVSLVRGPDGEIAGAARIIRDDTRRRQADRDRVLLLGELDHRVKNILATVSSVVSQTLHTSLSPEAFASAVEGRIAALSRAHGLLTEGGEAGSALEALLRTELAPYEDTAGRVTIAGPPIGLTPKAGLALAMAVHELSTNAAKYGALSTPEGRLSVTWEAAEGAGGPVLRIAWVESDGPPVTRPTRSGFGTALIQRALTYEFDAVVTRTFGAEGMACVIELPLTAEVAHIDPRVVPLGPGR